LISIGRWSAFAGVVVLTLVAVAGMSLAIYMAWLFHDMPNASELVDYHPPTATRVYAWDGTLIGEYSTERRIYVPYDQIPPQLSHAFLAAEDHNFFSHGGVDVGGVGRAMFKDVFNILQGRRPEGGSTITQQVAKNVLLTNEATLGRKLKEAILATRLEQALTKQQILELYLNEIWLGHDSYGVGAAAYNYFGKSIADLSLAQDAFLASLPKGPDNYNPAHHMQAALQRRNAILLAMAQLGWAGPADVDAALREPIIVQPPQRASYHDADYFVEEVRRQALAMFGDKVNQGGYYMRTTLDPRLQTAARIALMDGLETYDHRHGWRGAWGRVAIEPGWEKAAMARQPPSERRKWHVAVIEDISGGQVKAKVAADDSEGYLAPADVAWARAGKGLNVGDLVFVEPADTGGLRLRQIPQVNGAMVAMDPSTGRVLAMVGGYSFSLSSFNRATQAWRQPGSSFKPFVYATALENGFTPASIVSAGPISFPGANGQTWTPENYERNFPGPLIFRRGLELSLNTMTVRIAAEVGMPKIVANALKFGVVNKMDPVLAMALGSGETTPYKITSAYSAFLNGGRRINPHLIELVEDRDGKTIFRADSRECRDCNHDFTGDFGPDFQPAGQQVIDPITAYQIVLMLQGVVQHGTAIQARELNWPPVGGKTGTTNDFRSAWFIGFTPQIVVGTFVGFDDNRSLGHGETGAVAAVPIFIEFMKEALKGMPQIDFTPPPGAVFAEVGPNREAFQPGTEPSAHVAAPVGGGGYVGHAEPVTPFNPAGAPPPPPQTAPHVRIFTPKKPDELNGLF